MKVCYWDTEDKEVKNVKSINFYKNFIRCYTEDNIEVEIPLYLMLSIEDEDGAKPLIEYVRENYCSNRDVATGNYDCPYATTVLNTICCTGHECNYKGIYEKPVVNNSASYEPFVINEEDLPF